jgi:hypothetical protein
MTVELTNALRTLRESHLGLVQAYLEALESGCSPYVLSNINARLAFITSEMDHVERVVHALPPWLGKV